jgi:hypothetical protein
VLPSDSDDASASAVAGRVAHVVEKLLAPAPQPPARSPLGGRPA